MDSDSLPAASSSTVSQFTPLRRHSAPFEQGRQPAPSSLPDESFVSVEIRYYNAKQHWQLAPTESERLVLIYCLDWLPKRVQQACESTRTLPGHTLTTHILQADYRSIFRV